MNSKTISQLMLGNIVLLSCTSPAQADQGTDKPQRPAQDKSRPNIILIVTDDQPYETMNCWGGKAYTPNIDRLAEEGMKFERMYAASPISAASRYSILSGRYCSQCEGPQFLQKNPAGQQAYIDNTMMELEKDKNNLPKKLQRLGYKTGMVGKWHLGHHFDGNNDANRARQWQEAGLQYYEKTSDPADPQVAAALQHNHQWYAEQIKATGFDFADNIYWGNLKEVFNTQLNWHNIDWTVEGALDFIGKSTDNGDPFFLYFSTTLHHGPVPNNSVDSSHKKVTSKGFAAKEPDVLPDRESIYRRLEEHGINRNQAASLWLDDAVGRLMQELEDKHIDDNTIVIYLSDHGITQKGSLYEGGIKTPMMVWWKGHVLTNAVTQSLVSTCDIAPTLLDILGETIEGNPDGKSFRTVLTAPEKKIHESVYAEIGNARVIVTDRYKYIAVDWDPETQAKINRGLTPEEFKKIGYIKNTGLSILGKSNKNYFDRDQLFDLQHDKQETENLYQQERKTAGELQDMLSKTIRKISTRPFRDF